MRIQIVRHSSLSRDYSAILLPAWSSILSKNFFLDIAAEWSLLSDYLSVIQKADRLAPSVFAKRFILILRFANPFVVDQKIGSKKICFFSFRRCTIEDISSEIGSRVFQFPWQCTFPRFSHSRWRSILQQKWQKFIRNFFFFTKVNA